MKEDQSLILNQTFLLSKQEKGFMANEIDESLESVDSFLTNAF